MTNQGLINNMKIGIKEKSPDFREKIFDELKIYARFFQAPLPLYLLSPTSTDEGKEELVKALQEQNQMGKKLLKLTNNFHGLCENFYKSIQTLEEFKQGAGGKIENLQKTIDDFKVNEKRKNEENRDLNEHINHLEMRVQESESIVEKLSTGVEKYKIQVKNIEVAHEVQFKAQTDLHKKEKDALQVIIESQKKALNHSETIITALEVNFESATKALQQEKESNNKYRNDISLLKSENHELKLSMDSIKLKKSTYKQLLNSNNKKDAFQTSDHSKNSEKLSSESNDLLALEEEQSLAYNLNHFSLEVNDENSINNFSVYSEAKNESLIILFPPRPEEKLKISFSNSFSILPEKKPKNFSLSKTKNYKILPSFTSNSLNCPKSPVFVAVRSSAFKKYNKKILFSKVLSQVNLNRKKTSLPNSPKNLSMKTETWSDSVCVNQAETPYLNVQKINENETSRRVVESVPEDPIKDYFIKLCHKIKCNSFDPSKMSQIPTFPLYDYFMKHKVPLYKWPESISVYLSKRINQQF